MSQPVASLTANVNYSLKPTSVKCKRTTININASNKTTFQAGDVATFYMPSHANSVIDGSSCYLSFRVKATTTGYVQGSAHSFIDRLYTVSSGGNPISDIQNYRSIANTMLDLQLSHSERVGLSPMLGTEEEYFTATALSTTFATANQPSAQNIEQMVPKAIRQGKKLTTGVTYTFCIPLLHPIFGSLAEKYFPCYALSDVTRLEFTWSTVRNALVTCTDYEISNPTIYCDYLEFSDETIMGMIKATYAGRDLVIPAQDYHYYSATIPASSGSFSAILPCKAQSARMALMRFLPTETYAGTGANEYATLSSVNPFYTQNDHVALTIGGKMYPPKGIITTDTGNFAPHWVSTQQALHSLNNLEMNGSIPQSYYEVYPAQNKYKLSNSGTYPIGSFRNAYVVGINLDALRGQNQTTNSGLDLSQLNTTLDG